MGRSLTSRPDLDRGPDQGLDPVDRDRAVPVVLAVTGLADRVGRVGLDLVGRVGLGLVGRADLVDPDLTGLVDPAGRVGRRRRTRPGVPTIGVAPRWAAPGMRLTASARPTMVRRLRPHNTDSAGMVGLHPERRRLSGTDHRPRVAGTVHRLPVVGTARGTVRRVT